MAIMIKWCFFIVVSLLVSSVESKQWDEYQVDPELDDAELESINDDISDIGMFPWAGRPIRPEGNDTVESDEEGELGDDDQLGRLHIPMVEEDADEDEDHVAGVTSRKKRYADVPDSQYSWFRRKICWKLCKPPTEHPVDKVKDLIRHVMRSWSLASRGTIIIFECPPARTCADRPLARRRYRNSPPDIGISFVCNDKRSAYTFAQPSVTGHAYMPVPCHSLGGDIHISDCKGLALTEYRSGHSVDMVLKHEVGHALGLQAHSRDPSDTMFSGHIPIGWPKITSATRQRIFEKYYNIRTMSKGELNDEFTKQWTRCLRG